MKNFSYWFKAYFKKDVFIKHKTQKKQRHFFNPRFLSVSFPIAYCLYPLSFKTYYQNRG